MAGVLGTGSLWGQVQRYPADVNPVLLPPYTVFLSDYTAAGSDKLSANVIFNDFNEASWTFKLRLSIESMDVRLRTKNGFTPSASITVQPGVPFIMKGSDWVEYFNFSNLEVSGRNTGLIVNSGRLPEGMYSICLQVLDYTTGEVLSAESCRTVWIQLLDPPRVVGRECGEFLDPAISANINFNWQLFNTVSANNAAGTDFELTMWELTEPGAEPLSALQNGQALEVFRSGLVSNTNYNYGPADPLLEEGKTYLYRIQAQDADGKDRYKNNGFSEFCYFHYGWPVGGKIELKYPEYGYGFKRRDVASLAWAAPDNKLPLQYVNYEVVIKEFSDDQAPNDAFVANPSWYYRLSDPYNYNFTNAERLPFPSIDKGYAWQIKAFSNGHEVAKSDISVFYGPPVVERFFASNHRIEVDKITNKSLDNFSGSGRVRLSTEDVWTRIEFSNLQLSDFGGIVYLIGGEIEVETPPVSFNLQARNEQDGEAKYLATRYKISRNGLFVEGHVSWQLPFPLMSIGKSTVTSETISANFNNFSLTGSANLSDGNSFELLDPQAFKLDLAEESKVYVNSDVFWFDFSGTITTPSARSVENKPATWAFSETENLRTIPVSGPVSSVPLRVVPGTGISLQPASSIIDLDDQSSPGRFSADPYWKGIYIEQSALHISEALDEGGQFTLNEKSDVWVDLAASSTSVAAITGAGFTLKHDMAFTIEGVFNTFPATFTGLTLDITNQQVNEASRLRGSFLVPFVDVTTPLNFESQLASRGFRPGVLANLSGRTFRFNPDGGELAVDLAIKKGEMAGNNRLQMTLDVSWPSLNITLAGVNNFCVWGDRSVGFFVPEGIVALDHQVTATFKGYPVTIDALSAGRSKNFYGLAVSGKVVMGEDVSGDDGPPAFNLYSMVQNPLLDASYTPAPTQAAFNLADAQNGLDKLEAELAAFEADLTQKIEQEAAALESTTTDLIASASAGLGGQEYAVEEMVVVEEVQQEQSIWNIEDKKEKIIAILTELKPHAPNPADIDLIIQAIQSDLVKEGPLAELIQEFELNREWTAKLAVEVVAIVASEPLSKLTDSVNKVIVDNLSVITNTIYQEVDLAAEKLVVESATSLIAPLVEKFPKAKPLADQLVATVKQSVVLEITASVNGSINNNVIFPITSFVGSNIYDRGERLIRLAAESTIYDGLVKSEDLRTISNKVLSGTEEELADLGQEMQNAVDLNRASAKMRLAAEEAIGNISVQGIVNRLKQGVLEILSYQTNEFLTEKTSEALNNALGGEIGISIPMNYAGAMATLIRGGDIKDILMDPIPIKVRSPALDLNGLIRFTKGHPLYGDVYAGEVEALVKVPAKGNPFLIDVSYMNGRKQGVSFWLAEIGGAGVEAPNDASDFSKVGLPLGDELKEPSSGLSLGALEVMALKARVYKHMVGEPTQNMVPDQSNKYGAFLHFVAYGPKDGEVLRLEVDAKMNVATTGDYTVDFNGNAQIINTNPKVMTPDPTAVIQGVVALKYNSAEKHFLGYVAAALQKPGVLCAEGNLLVDIKPGQWRVALGNRDERLRFVLACAGFAPTGWLDLNQSTAQIGLGLELIFYQSFNVDLKVAKVALVVDAGAAAGINATVQYKPFQLNEAGLWFDMWARILLAYQMGLIKGDVSLVDIYLTADANIRFHPSPTILYGEVRGHLSVLRLFTFNLKEDFSLNL